MNIHTHTQTLTHTHTHTYTHAHTHMYTHTHTQAVGTWWHFDRASMRYDTASLDASIDHLAKVWLL
jgi:hypothetical protein